ncbi:EF-P lysine aminoacylase EpmA [Dasania sp. GY-MA-18]|uniref:EF-P lysine aminoacylase EpmA n=1 Tax=Dasania phycosphaerae TaxID=2950436 RepID=A0A9J6RMX1_9GAMM|nr:MULTISPECIES: EF-P lysine aminoacylase EpmA [Dasania]MCR8923104.1 EF-P lysine aminoacylase EpmA [Dasania sp. GY-MA-18]MCZ0865536.1 EF-P lysine aminoacylase EpmA [Dasania phycosphaerae]MCZ0869261.1 EF-P lysine aminoacylase EpmA [Dasania phycosphaerae]
MSVWQPSAAISRLQHRAQLLAQTRQFFAERGVLEVETPLLCQHAVTDPHMPILAADNPLLGEQPYYLQSSPEYAMKRLLAAGSGPIYQLCKAFRGGEQSRRHNPEFSMLEWYRPGFDHFQLMDEISDLLIALMAVPAAQQISYGELFEQHLGINPHTATATQLEQLARQQLDIQMHSDQRDDWLNLLIAEVIEPKLGFDTPLFIYDYPASQAALARLATDANGHAVAQRFELYVQGIELANGYFELTDSAEQARRFQQEQQQRQQLNQPAMASDAYLLAALESGLPECAGVALGFDRLVMLALQCERIDEVLSFTSDKA